MDSNPNKLLSIALPTCNRLGSLKEAIPDLIDKVKKHNIQIFISDNNSQDGTEDYIKSIQKEYPHIIYHKIEISDYNNANVSISAEKNIKCSLELSNTKYTLLLGDHYILYDETSIDTILSYLEKDDYDALILHHNRRVMAKDSDYLYTNKNEFLEDLGWYISMVSTTIYNKKTIESLDFEKFYKSNFAHTLALLDYISSIDFKIQYIDKVTTWTTKGGVKGLPSWHSKAIDIFTKSWYEGINSLPETFDSASKFKCIKNHPKYNLPFYSKKSLVLYKYAGGLEIFNTLKNIKYLLIVTDIKITLLAMGVSFIPKNSIKYIFKEDYKYIKRVLGEIDIYKK